MRNPIIFQGWGKKKDYFEGWYYKIVSPEAGIAMAIIPGVSLSQDDSHAFIQVMDGVRCHSEYYRFSIDSFLASPDQLSISIGDNSFSEQFLSLDLPSIKCELRSTSWTKLPKTWLRPGIMGWYSYLPTMQCYHGLGSMNHQWNGTWYAQESLIELKNAKGYVEKDWGTSFPKSWIWSQCNTFDSEKELSVFASVAHIPWKGNFFIGFLAAIYYRGTIEIFATYTGADRSTILTDDEVILHFSKGSKSLKIIAHKAPGSDLKSPISGEMTGKVNESMLATMIVDYKDDEISINAQGAYAGLEVAGPVEELITAK